MTQKPELKWSLAEKYMTEWKKRVVEVFGEPVEWNGHRYLDYDEHGPIGTLSITALLKKLPQDADKWLQLESACDPIASDLGQNMRFIGSVGQYAADDNSRTIATVYDEAVCSKHATRRIRVG